MKTRSVLATLALLLAVLAMPATMIAKEATVTLEITGMTWGSCASTVQSALQEVKGVNEASVSLASKEAVVKYDPDVVKVDDLIKAVKNARGMNSYGAKVKKTWWRTLRRLRQLAYARRVRMLRLIRSDREAIFYLCTLSVVDPRFRKYPMLPVLSCAEYEDDGKSVGGGNSER
jgi:copper chaperone CopZ